MGWGARRGVLEAVREALVLLQESQRRVANELTTLDRRTARNGGVEPALREFREEPQLARAGRRDVHHGFAVGGLVHSGDVGEARLDQGVGPRVRGRHARAEGQHEGGSGQGEGNLLHVSPSWLG